MCCNRPLILYITYPHSNKLMDYDQAKRQAKISRSPLPTL
jgi:hypothetical protein